MSSITSKNHNAGSLPRHVLHFWCSGLYPMSSYPHKWSRCRRQRKKRRLSRPGKSYRYTVGAVLLKLEPFFHWIYYIYMYTCSSLLLECGIYIYMSHVILPSHMVHTQELATAVHTTGIQEAGANQLLAAEKCASCLVIESRGTVPTWIYKSTEASSCKLPQGEAAFATTQEVYIQYICLYFINYII